MSTPRDVLGRRVGADEADRILSDLRDAGFQIVRRARVTIFPTPNPDCLVDTHARENRHAASARPTARLKGQHHDQ